MSLPWWLWLTLGLPALFGARWYMLRDRPGRNFCMMMGWLTWRLERACAVCGRPVRPATDAELSEASAGAALPPVYCSRIHPKEVTK